MKIILSCPQCKQSGYEVTLPLSIITNSHGTHYLGYSCYVCGAIQLALDGTSFTSENDAREELERIIYEEERESAEAEIMGRGHESQKDQEEDQQEARTNR